jgi:hypothetical protein
VKNESNNATDCFGASPLAMTVSKHSALVRYEKDKGGIVIRPSLLDHYIVLLKKE